MFDTDALTENLTAMPPRHRAAFAASCCERLLPNYAAFSRMEGWGDFRLLRQSLDYIWGVLEGTAPLSRERINQLKNACDNVIPDTEQFKSIYTSAALDAGNAVLETLECLLDGNPRRAVDVASFGRDTVDMYIQERDQLDYTDPDIEERIASDPLMVRELSHQSQTLAELAQAPALTPDLIRRLRILSDNAGKSNIDIQ